MYQLGQKLADKSVIDCEGSEIGTLHNISVDPRTGDMKSLLVNPRSPTPTKNRHKFPTNDEGHYQIPVNRVSSVKDYVIID
ncbi:PRC-barrel domain-containing protein [Haloquadratum walsbyi]|jgi:Uncharacterized conserved protein|uniref:PRC-barrel domain-containing protein n=1 Tax=Haloquadratum walsbyi J07HQW2 TaxID=1238425 RepID=U1NB00_9EURY|nr:PRC-barrel domain-containing protein [Haloquadratum walsbyi]ERG93793.1 MAG: hypothetical protein J07HQW2_00227 [Haloquadratum walsbyi J07HQW2]